MGNEPFLLSPVGKDYLWGGNKLKVEFSKNIDVTPLAESWECSTHPEGLSKISTGENKGKTLKEILDIHPEYIGTHPKTKGELPILVKLIDAKENLSVQVHPNDQYADFYENGQQGKTEMWYVLDAEPNAKLVYGFKKNMTKDGIRKAVTDGNIENYMNAVDVHKNDLFFIEPGVIHSIGKGIVIAEIQQNSDLTYRLYDYDRVDKNGKKRELHIKKALDVVNLNAVNTPRQPMRVLKYSKGKADELLTRCKYFEVHRMLINTQNTRSFAEFKSDSLSFRVLLSIDGCCVINYNNETIYVYKGDCIFVPANSVNMRIHGKISFLDIRG